MFKFALIWLVLCACELTAQIELFSAKSKEQLYLFTKNYHLTTKLADKLLEFNSGFPLEIVVIGKTANTVDAYILTPKNQNMRLSITQSGGYQKISIKTTQEKFAEKYTVQKYNSNTDNNLETSNENKKFIRAAMDIFLKNAGKRLQSISTLSKSTIFGNIRMPLETKALMLEGDGVYMFAFVYNGELYDKNGMLLSGIAPSMPVDFDRVSDFYSASRLHPILNYFRAHEGVDLVAKYGTPVVSVLEGYISELGYSPNIGNYVRIAHQNGFESIYGHLSKIRGDLSVGKKVEQKETIALVGQTGLATGPHLHFGVKKDGHYINPAIFFRKQERRIYDQEFFAFTKSTKEKFLKKSITSENI